jgi:hypothetical protein
MKLPPHKCGLYLTHNDHRTYFESAVEWLGNSSNTPGWESDAHRDRAIATDEIWTLQWYPETPVGFNLVAAPTLEELLAFANKVGG